MSPRGAGRKLPCPGGRLDLLPSWRPSPDAVACLGHGREVTDDEAFRFGGPGLRTDGPFLEPSYRFRN
jgi:hypothetical protein